MVTTVGTMRGQCGAAVVTTVAGSRNHACQKQQHLAYPPYHRCWWQGRTGRWE